MSRTDGYRLLACPLCHTIHATPHMVCFGFMVNEYWSDSYRVQSLFESRQGLRKCTACHDFYLQSEAPYIGRLTSDQASRLVATPPDYIPAFLRRTGSDDVTTANTSSDSAHPPKFWLRWLKKWWVRKPFYQLSTENTQEDNKGPSKKYQYMMTASDSDLAGILENQEKYSVALIQATRVRYWIYLNGAYRDTTKALIEKGQIPHSAFNPTEIQIDNMRTLLALLEFANGGYRAITIAELHRELGQFDRAIQILEKITEPDYKSEAILEAARQGVRAPILIPYSSYQKS